MLPFLVEPPDYVRSEVSGRPYGGARREVAYGGAISDTGYTERWLQDTERTGEDAVSLVNERSNSNQRPPPWH